MSELNHPLRIEEPPSKAIHLVDAGNGIVAAALSYESATIAVLRFAALASQAQEVLMRRVWEICWRKKVKEWDLDITSSQQAALHDWTPPNRTCLYQLIVDADEELKRREAKP